MGCLSVSVRKDTIESEFLEVLASIEAGRSVLLLLADIVRDAWDDRLRTEADLVRNANAKTAGRGAVDLKSVGRIARSGNIAGRLKH